MRVIAATIATITQVMGCLSFAVLAAWPVSNIVGVGSGWWLAAFVGSAVLSATCLVGVRAWKED